MTERLYFAYGSNLDPRQMTERCPGAKPMGAAALNGWRFLINRRGYATVTPEPDSVVQGGLWVLTLAHEVDLDEYEGVAGGHYTKEQLEVIYAADRAKALVYVDPVMEPGRPWPGYMEGVLHGAAHFDLSPAYLTELKTWQ
ncbi:MAG: gamma-glutamylcyclotransferase [Verrucomicrobiales bacterium]|nr:gamma-glutamylcyclotransferase [Verrucomicrobiales bacterium]